MSIKQNEKNLLLLKLRTLHKMFHPLRNYLSAVWKTRCHKHLSSSIKQSMFCFLHSLFNPLNPELNPICYLLALLAHHFLYVSRIRVKSLTIRLLMSYVYMERLFLMFLDHTQRRSTVGRAPLDE